MAPTLLSSLQTEQAEFVRPAVVSALAALGDDTRVQRALLGEIGRGLDFFRGAVIDALGRRRAAYALDGVADRREAAGTASGRCGACARADWRCARARDF